MKNARALKRTLLTGIITIILCVYMLIGTTFAWFTDTSSVSVGKIQAGRLNVELLMWNGSRYENISENPNPVFGAGSIAQNNNAETVWEPGKTQVAYLAIVNSGNLSLKYQVGLNITNPEGGKNLYEAMQYTVIPDAQATVETPSPVTSWNSANAKSVVLGRQIVTDGIIVLPVGAIHYFALSVHMSETSGNIYQESKVDFDLTVYAAQMNYESDSFGTDYDESAEFSAAGVAKNMF